MPNRRPSTPKIDEAVARSVNFETTIADLARRSERRAWGVASGAIVMSLILAGGYFYMLPLKEKVPFLVMADAYTGTSTVARLTDDIVKVDIIAKAVSYMAGYNIRLLPIIQSVAQLDATYGKEVARTLITNHALQIVYAPREQQDANDYSEMLGYTTVRKENLTRSRGDVSRGQTEERRALMLPQELKAMGPEKEVFLYEGIPHPVMCEKIRYYQDRYFTARLLPKVDIPTLAI